jgi:predicted amidohydrolase
MMRSLFVVAMWAAFTSGSLGQDLSKSETVEESVRLGLMRGVPEKWNLEGNFAVFLERLEEAHAQGAQVFITPECWLDGYAAADPASTRERLRSVAQDLTASPYLKRVSEEAARRKMLICFGFTSLEGERLYNAAGLWNAEGTLVGIYHKTHLQAHDLQYDYGDALAAWPTPWGPVGMMICADRRWPETARVLRLQGARLILNPTYGYRGDLNTAMMRTRAMENQCFIAFAHPEESLVTGPKGNVLAQETGDGGVLICEVNLAEAKVEGHPSDRRPELYGKLSEGVKASPLRKDYDGPVLRVAAAQMLSTFDVDANVRRMEAMLEEARERGVRVVVFPEMALTGYTKSASFREVLNWEALDAGMARLQEACRRLDLYAVVGAPTRDGDRYYCSAVTLGPDGSIVDVYEKIYRAGEAWAEDGRRLSTFEIDGTECGTFICHDERYAPLVQLRALAGAKVFFYISCESGVEEFHKINPYRAQVQARAPENGVFVVHANTPAAANRTGLADVSHGESRVVGPDGNILAEAPVYGEQLVIADLQLARSSGKGLKAALTSGPLAEWMRAGVALVAEKKAPESGDDGWRPLFDGKTLEGWEGDAAWFRVEDGAIVAGSLKERIPHNHFLCTTESYGDFELRLNVKLAGDDPNAGVQIRSRRKPDSTEVIGYQADLGQQYWGCLYDEERRKRVIAQADPELIARSVRKDDWNEYLIRCEGPRVRLWLNGVLTVDYVEEDDSIERSGIIGLQIHSGAPAEARYKDIAIRPLTPETETAAAAPVQEGQPET